MATYVAYFAFLFDFPCPTVHILEPKKEAFISDSLLECLYLQTLYKEILYFPFSFILQVFIKFLLCAMDYSKC